MTEGIRTAAVHGTVADGFEAVREEFAAFVAGERADYEGQLTAYVHGRRVVDLWAGPVEEAETGGDALHGVFVAGFAICVAALASSFLVPPGRVQDLARAEMRGEPTRVGG